MSESIDAAGGFFLARDGADDRAHDVLGDAQIADQPRIEVGRPRARSAPNDPAESSTSRVSIVSSTGWPSSMRWRWMPISRSRYASSCRQARRPCALHLRILLHVVEEVLERRLDPEVHLLLVRDDAVVLGQRRLRLPVDRRPVVGQHLGRQLERAGPRRDRHAEISVAERHRHVAGDRLHDVDASTTRSPARRATAAPTRRMQSW